MTRLLLVDDEPMLLRGMEQTLKQELDMKNILKAYSGLEAIEILENDSIDIVVTDIRMPGMDGIQLSQYIQENFVHTKCIILSGYAEFEYAKSAMKFNVVDYLIKPVKEEELIQIITNTVRLLEEEKERTSSHEEFLQNLPMLRSQLLNELLLGTVTLDKELTRKLESYKVNIKTGDHVTLLFIRLDEWFTKSSEVDRSIYEYAIINMVNDFIDGDFDFWYGNDPFGTLIYLIKSKDLHQQDKIQNIIVKTMKQVQEHVETLLKGKISLFVSQTGVFPDDLLSIYQRSLDQIWRVPKSQMISVLTNEDRAMHSPKTINSLYSPPSLTQLLELGRWNDAKEKLKSIKNEVIENNLETEEHKYEIFYAVFQAFTHLANLKGRSLWELIGNNINMLNGPQYFRDISHFILWSIHAIENFVSKYDTTEGKNQQEIIGKIQKFVEKNVADATLQSIADYVKMHPVYLSSLYKKKTNENLSEFILRYRMEKAKELLLTSDIKIFKLAEQCGFQNPPYFSKQFKSYYGITPQECRERYQRIRQY
jgi:two-component system response regulator YesN